MNFETAEVTYEKPHRLSGILLHPTSCPSPYGIGDLGQDAYDFVDFLEKSGQHLWQILPLTPTGFGDSPYQSFSAFAGQPLLISPAHLKELGLLEEAELSDCPRGDGHHVDYGTIIPWKFKILASAFSRFLHTSDKMLLEEYDAFYNANQFWLDDYALFMACKAMHDGKDWLSWEEAYRRPTDSLKKELKKQLSNEIQYHYFVQFLFFKEWYALKKICKRKGYTDHRRHPNFCLFGQRRCLGKSTFVPTGFKRLSDFSRRCPAGLFFDNRTALGQSALQLGCP